MVIDEEIGLEWAQNSTFLLQLLCISICNRFSAATALSKQILEEGEPAVDTIFRIFKSRKLRLSN